MTTDPMGRLSAADPLPGGSTAPPFTVVHARLVEAAANRRLPRFSRLAVPALTLAVSAGVIVVTALAILGGTAPHGSGSAASRTRPGVTGQSTGRVSVPRGGMPGYVWVPGAAFNSQGNGSISIEQCLRCQVDGNQTRHSDNIDWLVDTQDGGRSWSLQSTKNALTLPQLSGQDGWSSGFHQLTRAQAGHEAAYQQGVSSPAAFVTHDGGRTWRESSDATGAGSLFSIAGGEVWGTMQTSDLKTVIGRAPTSDSSLVVSPSQPFIAEGSDTSVLAAGVASAYAVNGYSGSQLAVTDNNGATWRPIDSPCPSGRLAGTRLDAAAGSTVWLTCTEANRPARVLRSLDAGQTWREIDVARGSGFSQLTAVGPLDAWAMTSDGRLLRTTDAGATWRTVWSLRDARVSPLSGPIRREVFGILPMLSAASTTQASVVALLNRGPGVSARSALTNLVVYRTTDGGATWRTEPVPLRTRP